MPKNNLRSRWTDVPGMREACANMFAQELNSGYIVEVLNEKYGAQMRKAGYSQLTRNMLIGEKHRERIKERRLAGLTVKRIKKGHNHYIVPDPPKPKPPLPYPWMGSALFDGIRVKPRVEEEADNELE